MQSCTDDAGSFWNHFSFVVYEIRSVMGGNPQYKFRPRHQPSGKCREIEKEAEELIVEERRGVE